MVATHDQYGAPSYGPIGRPVAGQVYHTPENADPTLASAIAIAKWQASASNTSGGSYHGILGHDSVKFNHPIKDCVDPTHWTMVRSVPWDKASGGLSTRRDSIWAPSRYPWIKQMVHAAAFADPNKYMHQIALSGKAAWYVTNGYPKGAVIALAEWCKILEKAYTYDAVLTLHRHWQTNRSDPGPLTLPDLVVTEYIRLNTPAPVPVPTPTPVDPKVYTQREHDAIVNPLKAKITSKDTKLDSAIALLRDARDD